MDIDVDELGNPIEPVLDKPPIIPEVSSLEKSSWQNVVSLLETQNALMSKKLENLEPTLSALTENANACKTAAEKCANKVDEMTALKATLPEDVTADTTLPPVVDDTKPIKKKGLFSKK